MSCTCRSVKSHVELSLLLQSGMQARSLDSTHLYLLCCLAHVLQLYASSKHRVRLSVSYVSPCSVLMIHITGTLRMGVGHFGGDVCSLFRAAGIWIDSEMFVLKPCLYFPLKFRKL